MPHTTIANMPLFANPHTTNWNTEKYFLSRNLLQSRYLRKEFGDIFCLFMSSMCLHTLSLSVFHISSPMTDYLGFGYRMQRKKRAEVFSCLLSSIQTSLVAQMVKHLPTMWKTWVQSLVWKDLLEKEMATHPSILAWKIPRMEEPGRLQCMGSQKSQT